MKDFFGFTSICMLAAQCIMKNAIWFLFVLSKFKVGYMMQFNKK